MPRVIVHHEGHFFEWSAVVGAPTTLAMPREEFEAYYQHKYGQAGMKALPRRLEKAIATGTSSYLHASAEELMEGNRAGPDKRTLPSEEVIRLAMDRPEATGPGAA